MSSADPLLLDALPTEILLHILAPLSTLCILPLAAVSRRFHAVVLRLLCDRLTRATTLPAHRLIVDCYHPAAQLSTPYLLGHYLGTDDLDDASATSGRDDSGGRDERAQQLGLGGMKRLYSRFRVVPQEENRRPRVRYPRRPPAGQSQQAVSALGHAAEGTSAATAEPERVSHDVHLEEAELFSQLCTITTLAKLGPRPGLHRSSVNVSEGVIRVWRNWLAARSSAAETALEVGLRDERDTEHAILWADASKRVGLRFRVFETVQERRPLLVASNEDPPVSYRLEHQELLVQTTQLLLGLEKSEALKLPESGNEIMFV